MKKITLILIAVFTISIILNAQENKSLKLTTGVRVNPLLIYDLSGNVNEKVLLHGELGALFNKKIYTSVGYTAAMNAIYNFNEYWFLGFDKKLPVSWVLAEEYNLNNKMFFIQTGPNIKLSKIGNVFAFLFTPVNQFDLGLKIGVFIPLNYVIMKK
ncbi:MAG: hypothetical protein L3J56_04500 [Bacteroidales bacterium]|nr:hypothetical protein [Bacteroidales bacterium]